MLIIYREKGLKMLVMHNNKRRHEPSYTVPFIFEVLEMMMIWIVFSIMEGTMDVMQWNTITYILALTWLSYTLYKLNKVLDRQTKG